MADAHWTDRVASFVRSLRADSSVWSVASGVGDPTSSPQNLNVSRVRWLSKREADDLVVTSSFMGRLVYGPASDMLAPGWRVDREDSKDLSASDDERLRTHETMVQGVAGARHYGGAWVWPVIRGELDLSAPLSPGPHEIERLHVIEASEATPNEWDSDPYSPNFGRPRTWWVTFSREGFGLSLGPVHHSRLIYLPGLPLSATQDSPRGSQGYDLSAVQAYWESVKDVEMTAGSMADLVKDKSIPVLKIGEKPSATAGSGRAAMQALATAIRKAQSVTRMTVIGASDEMQRLDASMQGLRDPLLAQYERMSAREGIPLQELMGWATTGLGSTDDQSRERYRRFLAGEFRRVVEPALVRLYDIAMGEDDKRKIVRMPYDEPTASEQAKTALDIATGAEKWWNMGVPVDFRAMLESETVPAFPPLLDAESIEVEPSEQDADDARALLDGATPPDGEE